MEIKGAFSTKGEITCTRWEIDMCRGKIKDYGENQSHKKPRRKMKG